MELYKAMTLEHRSPSAIASAPMPLLQQLCDFLGWTQKMSTIGELFSADYSKKRVGHSGWDTVVG